MPSDQERKDLIQGLLDNGVPVDKLKAAVGSLKSPEQQELFFQTAAQKLGRSYGSAPEAEGYRPPSGAEFTPDSALTPGKQLIKDAAAALPSSLALAGGLVGGTAAGAATLGMGAPAGAVTLAAAGGALGTSLKNAIMSLVQPEEAPQNPVQAMASATQGAVEGATQEMGGRVLGAGLQVAGKGVSKAVTAGAKKLKETAIPGFKKVVESLGGENGAQTVLTAMDDYAVMKNPTTAGRISQKLGAAKKQVETMLNSMYDVGEEMASKMGAKNIPRAAKEEVTPKIVERLKAIYGSTPLEENEIKHALKRLGSLFPDESITPQTMRAAAIKLEKGVYSKGGELLTIDQKLGLAIREQLEETIAQVSPAAAESIKRVSKAYRVLSLARIEAVKASKQKFGLVSMLKVAGIKIASNPVAGAAAVAYELSPTLAKTTASAVAQPLAKYSTKLIELAPQLGEGGRTVLRLASQKGLDAALKYHTYQLLNNAKYAEQFQALGGIKIDESGEQGGQQ